MSDRSLCAAHFSQPSDSERCNSEACPHWLTGKWSECGNGDGHSYCDETTNRKRRIVCSWRGEHVEVTKCNTLTGGVQRPHETEDCRVKECTAWKTTEWTECSAKVTCNNKTRGDATGVRTRQVYCEILDTAFLLSSSSKRDFLMQQTIERTTRLVEDTKCNPKTRPASLVECDASPAAAVKCPEWRVSAWSVCVGDCSAGIGHRTRTVYCSEGGYNASLCKTLPKPANHENCTRACMGEWKVSEWSEVSTNFLLVYLYF